jgi:hypothetical protein
MPLITESVAVTQIDIHFGVRWGQTAQQRGSAEARHEGVWLTGIASTSSVKLELRKGTGLGEVTGAVSGRLCNCSYPRRSDADMRGP